MGVICSRVGMGRGVEEWTEATTRSRGTHSEGALGPVLTNRKGEELNLGLGFCQMKWQGVRAVSKGVLSVKPKGLR